MTERTLAIRAVAALTLVSSMTWAQEAPVLELRCAKLQESIDAARRSGSRRAVIPAGTYRLVDAEGDACLSFRGLEDVTIDARGVTLLRTDPTKGAIELHRCRGVTLRGLTLVLETPPFTQGEIVAVDRAGGGCDVRLDGSYPELDEPGRFPDHVTVCALDPGARRWRRGGADDLLASHERIGEHVFRMRFSRSLDPESGLVRVGGRVAFLGRAAADIRVAECAGMVLADITIRGGSGLCILETGGDGGNRYAYTVTYGPKPRGAEVEPHLACVSDAFHSRAVRKGPVLEGCLLEGVGGNGVVIRGTRALGRGFVLRDNIIRRVRKHRIVLQTEEGRVEGNRIEVVPEELPRP